MPDGTNPYKEAMEETVEEYLRRDLLPDDLVDRVDRLCAKNQPGEALELILEHRVGRRGSTSVSDRQSSGTE